MTAEWPLRRCRDTTGLFTHRFRIVAQRASHVTAPALSVPPPVATPHSQAVGKGWFRSPPWFPPPYLFISAWTTIHLSNKIRAMVHWSLDARDKRGTTNRECDKLSDIRLSTTTSTVVTTRLAPYFPRSAQCRIYFALVNAAPAS